MALLLLVIERKKIYPEEWFSIFVAIFGFYLLTNPGQNGLKTNDLILLASAFFFGTHVTSIHYLMTKLSKLQIFYASAVQFAVVSILAFVTSHSVENYTQTALVSSISGILYTGIVVGGIGYSLQAWGQKYTHPTTASLILSLEAVFAAIGAHLILKESFTTTELIAFSLIFVSIIIIELPHKYFVKKSKKHSRVR